MQKYNLALEDHISTQEVWIQHTVNIDSLDYDEAWVGKVISKGLKRNQNIKC